MALLASDCYDLNPDLTKFYQGDILQDVPFPTWPTLEFAGKEEKWAILRPLVSTQRAGSADIKQLPSRLIARAKKSVSDAFHNETQGEYIMALCKKRTVMVLTRSCALDHTGRKHLVVAPVLTVTDLPVAQQAEDKLTDLRRGKIPQSFYLPAIGSMPEAFVDLFSITYLHRSFLPDGGVQGKLIARLNSVGTLRLQNNLSMHFGTKFGFDYEDICPQHGTYSCSFCFHSGNDAVKRTFAQGVPFGVCLGCGKDACFVKV